MDRFTSFSSNNNSSSLPPSSSSVSSSIVHSRPRSYLVAAAYGISKQATQAMVEQSNTQSVNTNIAVEPRTPAEALYGEDAFMIANYSKYVTKCAAIADGVGGWSAFGVDPGRISRMLMKFAQQYIQQNTIQEIPTDNLNTKFPNHAYNTLQYAYKNVTDYNISKIRAGSTTACVVYLTDNAVLHSANLGDSGFMVLRGEEIVFRSKEMQHRFNAPYQIAVCPKERNGECIMNTPEQADLNKLQLKNGDVVVLGTDGLFDNCFDSHIVTMVNQIKNRHQAFSIQQEHERNYEIAKQLCLYARLITHIQHPDNKTPFGLAYHKEFKKVYSHGGKVDDICCVVCSVHANEN
jgi:protein phosphatase PTC7